MEWRSLVWKNTLHSLRRYLGYLLAGVLAVTVFFMFSAFADNPAVRQGYMTQTAAEMLIVCRVIIGLFAIFFIFYFHAALIRMRNKEFGLLMTLGVTPRQVAGMIFNESLLIGLAALLAGIVLGSGGTWLFLLAMASLLALPNGIPFALPTSAFLTTAIFFGLVFLLEATLISLRVRRRTPRLLILGARVQQTPPQPSRLLTIVGLLCLLVAYVLALVFSTFLLLTMIPIIALTIIGTYLLFGQVCVFLLRRLRDRTLHGLSLLVVARLSYRIRDYARMLTVVTILNAVVLTGMGTIFGGMRALQDQVVQTSPVAIQLVSNVAHPTALSPQRVMAAIQTQHLHPQYETTTSVLVGKTVYRGNAIYLSVLSLSQFRNLRDAILLAHPGLSYAYSPVSDLAPDQAHFYTSFPADVTSRWFPQQQVALQVGSSQLSLHIDQGQNRIFNGIHGIEQGNGIPDSVIVVNDQVYSNLNAHTTNIDHWQVSSYFIADWQQSGPLVNTLRQQLPADQQPLLSDTVTRRDEVDQLFSVMLFAGFFVSCLFFLAAGCSIYFKLFNQQEEDQRQFRALERVGMRSSETRKIIGREFALLFFIPVVIGIIHSVVALLDLSILLSTAGIATAFTAVLTAFALIGLLYSACFAIYYWLARANYARRVHLSLA